MSKVVKLEKSKRITVDKGIPLPSTRVTFPFPWEDMEPGDSFFVPVTFERETDSVDALHKRMNARCQTASKQFKTHYTARKVTDGTRGEGVRVWRTEPRK